MDPEAEGEEPLTLGREADALGEGTWGAEGLGRTVGGELGRTLGLEPRAGLGEDEGRVDPPPLEGRGAELEPRDP